MVPKVAPVDREISRPCAKCCAQAGLRWIVMDFVVHGIGALPIVFVGPLPILVLFFRLLNRGSLFTTLEMLGGRILNLRPKPLGSMSKLIRLDTAIRRLASARGRLALGAAWQLAGLIVGFSETWLAFRWLGHPVSVPAPLALSLPRKACARSYSAYQPSPSGD